MTHEIHVAIQKHAMTTFNFLVKENRRVAAALVADEAVNRVDASLFYTGTEDNNPLRKLRQARTKVLEDARSEFS